VIIRVTREDIKRGLRASSYSCPLALALARQFPGKGYLVSDEVVYDSDGDIVWWLGKAARRWVARFDADGPAQATPRALLLCPPTPS